MLQTTHYNLNLVEGTDIVNPLVQQNPNYSAIDAAMYANKQASIGSATEVTAGTVHTITRLNPDSNYVRFTATSNWTSGDSMVVDTTPVSVYLSDGTAPDTGAYVINTEVLMLVNGSRVTLLTSGELPANVAYTNATNTFSVNQTIDRQDGTTLSPGSSRLILGNLTPQGTAGNSRGVINFCNGGGFTSALTAKSTSADVTHELPNKSGTIALTSDLIEYYDFAVTDMALSSGATPFTHYASKNISAFSADHTVLGASVLPQSSSQRAICDVKNDESSVYIYGTDTSNLTLRVYGIKN